jgi:hypothetical protein
MKHLSLFFKSGDTVAHCIVADEHKDALLKLGLSETPEDAAAKKATRRAPKKAETK